MLRRARTLPRSEILYARRGCAAKARTSAEPSCVNRTLYACSPAGREDRRRYQDNCHASGYTAERLGAALDVAQNVRLFGRYEGSTNTGCELGEVSGSLAHRRAARSSTVKVHPFTGSPHVYS